MRKWAYLMVVAAAMIALVPLVVLRDSPAQAGFHLMRIDEVMAGVNGDSTIQFVELKMISSGQRFVGGRTIHFYDATGSETGRFTFPDNVSNGATGSSILVGTLQFAAVSTVAPDFTMSPGIMSPSGRVCFQTIDCVAYGDFTGSNSGYGSPAAALPVEGLLSLKRGRTATPKNNATDYALGTPAPRNNSGTSGVVSVSIAEHDVDGRVALEGRTNHGGAEVTFSGQDPVFTDAGGRFQLRVPAGDYDVTVTKEGFLAADATGLTINEETTLSTVKLLGGDINLDGTVDIKDLMVPAKNLGKDESPWPEG